MTIPLMPKATAVWLVDNTSLSFEQIADFCGLHALEVKGIADGEVALGIKGLDPVAAGQLSRAEIERCQADPDAQLVLQEPKHKIEQPKRKGPRYTPVSKRQDRPDAILWLLRHHPELSDSQVSKLVGTTKPTIESIRDRSHWNMANLKPVDPVQLGLCKQADLDDAVEKANRRKQREAAKLARENRIKAAEAGEEYVEEAPTPLDALTAAPASEPASDEEDKPSFSDDEVIDPESVFKS